MTEQPQTWHYGLMAQWWAEFNVDGTEIAYFQTLIERHGQPALDVACGTGRLLLPYLRAGLDVDGCDISPDMITLCREKAEREGLSPQLYAQAMHELDLPRTYQTIIVCGAFGIGGNREQEWEALRRLYQHLEPGGVLALDNYVPYGSARDWQYWLKENQSQLPEAWPPPRERRRMAHGSELLLQTRRVALEPLEQLLTLQMRAEQWRDGQLVAEEERLLQERLYFPHELSIMLAQVGFKDIQLQGDYTETEATAEHEVVVFLATK
jgi:SAM-dependent methyltransferase